MRNCLKCVYATWLTKKDVYCMFFASPTCPGGAGMELNFKGKEISEPIVSTEEANYPPPYQPKNNQKPRGVLREHHYEIYKMRYEQSMLYKDIAKFFGITSSAIMNYINRCNQDYIDEGNEDWARFIEDFSAADLKQDGLTKDGNIPPFKVSKFATRHVNSPLRKNHDKIFNLRKQGYTLSQVAAMLGLNKGSLYAYVERCETEWSEKAGD